MFNFNFLLAGVLFLSHLSFSAPFAKERVNKWNDGFAFFGALGITGASYVSNQNSHKGAIGPSISSAIAYCEGGSYCIEFGSIINANFFDDLTGKKDNQYIEADVIMWQSSFYLGARNKFPVVEPTDYWNPWYKIFFGYGTSVGFIREINDDHIEFPEDVRIHSEGPIWGLGFVFNFNAFNDKLYWFIETTQTVQLRWNNYMVQPSAELPVILETFDSTDNSHIFQINLNVGVRFF